jgi:hypothetical protein
VPALVSVNVNAPDALVNCWLPFAQGDDAEAEGLGGFGADDGATEGRLLGRGAVRAYQTEQPADFKVQAAAE